MMLKFNPSYSLAISGRVRETTNGWEMPFKERDRLVVRMYLVGPISITEDRRTEQDLGGFPWASVEMQLYPDGEWLAETNSICQRVAWGDDTYPLNFICDKEEQLQILLNEEEEAHFPFELGARLQVPVELCKMSLCSWDEHTWRAILVPVGRELDGVCWVEVQRVG